MADVKRLPVVTLLSGIAKARIFISSSVIAAVVTAAVVIPSTATRAAANPAPGPAPTPATTMAAPSVQAWARATIPGTTIAVAYATIQSPRDDRLLSVTSPQAVSVSLHDMAMQNGIMVMRPLPGGVALPASKPVTFAPGGDHLMLNGVKAVLKPGDVVHLHLQFLHAPPMDVVAPVKSLAATTPTDMQKMDDMK